MLQFDLTDREVTKFRSISACQVVLSSFIQLTWILISLSAKNFVFCGPLFSMLPRSFVHGPIKKINLYKCGQLCTSLAYIEISWSAVPLYCALFIRSMSILEISGNASYIFEKG